MLTKSSQIINSKIEDILKKQAFTLMEAGILSPLLGAGLGAVGSTLGSLAAGKKPSPGSDAAIGLGTGPISLIASGLGASLLASKGYDPGAGMLIPALLAPLAVGAYRGYTKDEKVPETVQ